MNMASNGERFNKEVVCLVKTVDFDIKIVSIRGCMQKLEPYSETLQRAKYDPRNQTHVGMSDELRE